MARLGDVCVINPKAPPIEDTLLVSFVPMPKVGEEGEFDSSETRPYAEVKKGFTYFAEGDVLFAKITPCMENGKGAVAHDLENRIGYGSTEFHVLRPKSGLILGEWLYYLTAWPAFRKEAERNMTGSAGQKRVPKDFLENYRLTVPSIHDQQQHVQTLNKLCALISLRKQQIAKLDELVKARFVEMFGDPVSNPKGWEMAQLSSLAEIKIGPFGSLLHKEDYVSEEHPLVNPSHIVDGRIVVDNELTVNDAKYEEMVAYHLHPGDVVLGRRGEMGRCAVVYEQGMLCGTGSLIIRPSDMMHPYFLQKIISYPTFKKAIEDMAVGVTMMNLNVPIVSSFMIPVLPRDQQDSYLAFVAQTDQQKLTIQHSLAKLELLKKALMQKYFG